MLMAAFFMIANGLALLWTLGAPHPHTWRGVAVVLIGISAALVPATTWGMFRLPRLELAQGYLFAQPLPADEIDGLLRTDPWRLITISR